MAESHLFSWSHYSSHLVFRHIGTFCVCVLHTCECGCDSESEHVCVSVLTKVLKNQKQKLQFVDKRVEHIREHLSHFHEVLSLQLVGVTPRESVTSVP